MSFQRWFRLPNLENGLLGRKLRQDLEKTEEKWDDLAKGGPEGIGRDRHFHPGSGDGPPAPLPAPQVLTGLRGCGTGRDWGGHVGTSMRSGGWADLWAVQWESRAVLGTLAGQSGHQPGRCPNAGPECFVLESTLEATGSTEGLVMGTVSCAWWRQHGPVKVRVGVGCQPPRVSCRLRGRDARLLSERRLQGQWPGACEARSELKPGSRGEGQLCRRGFQSFTREGGAGSWRVGGNSAVT